MKINALVLFLLLALTPVAFADTFWVGMEDIGLPGGDRDYNDLIFRLQAPGLTIAGLGAWQSMTVPNQGGVPYWDNLSWDGGGYGVGYFMTGAGAWAGNPASPAIPVSSLQYWGIGTNPDNSFLMSASGLASANILAEVSAWTGSNQLFWFNQSTPNNLNLLFPGGASAGASVSFNPGGNFGFLFSTPSGNFSSDGNGSQFTVFRGSASVPEPSTLVLLGTSLLMAGIFCRRRRQ